MTTTLSSMVASLLNEAVPLHQKGRLQAAQSLYRRVLEISPRDFDALHLLGVIARQSGQAEHAIELIAEAISIDATQAQAHCNLGAALHDSGRTQDALASYALAVRLNPHYDLAFCNRGNALRTLGRWEEALCSYDRALEIRPGYPEASCNRAMVLQDLGRWDDALASANRALAGRAHYADACCARGNALQSLGRYADALESYERALAIKGDDAELFCCRGTALQRLRHFDEALQSYDRAIALRHDYPAAHQFRANTCQSLGRRAEAIAGYREALALGGNAEQILFALAALGAEPVPSSAPATYVKALFNQYADHFDQHLVDVLDYQTPSYLDAAIARLGAQQSFDTLDLGCGTGLCGPFLRPCSRSLTGVDLSEHMLVKAHVRQLYDRLECLDISDFLSREKEKDAYDLVVAADVLVYFGDLAPLFALVHDALRSGGSFCFSVEQGAGADFTLNSSNRFAHSLAFLERAAGAASFVCVEAELKPLRAENGVQVMGHVVLLRKMPV